MDQPAERGRGNGDGPDRRAVLGALATGVGLAGCAGLPGGPGADGSDANGDEDRGATGDGGADDGADGSDDAGDGADGTGTDTPAPGTAWAQFRADAANSGHAGGSAPRGDAVRWRTELNRTARSSPAVVDGTAYVATGNGGLYAYDTGSGAEQWHVDIHAASGTTPAVTADAVFVATDSGAARVSRNGQLGWQRSLTAGEESLRPPGQDGAVGARRSAGPRTGPLRGGTTGRLQSSDPARASPTVADDRLYIGLGSEILALGTETGATRWRTDLGGAPRTPAVLGNGELRVSVGSDIVGMDPAGGVQFRTEVGEAVSATAVADGIAYVTARDADGRAVVVACGPDGEVRWRTAPAESEVRASRLTPPAERLAGPGHEDPGRHRSAQVSFDPDSTPAVGPDGVYIGTGAGVAALDRGGGVRWRVELESTEGSPAVVGDRVYAATERAVVVLDRADGSEQQRTRLTGGQQAAGGGGNRGRFATGRLQIDTGPTATPAVADGVYVPAVDEGGTASLVAVD